VPFFRGKTAPAESGNSAEYSRADLGNEAGKDRLSSQKEGYKVNRFGPMNSLLMAA
jgi:hypothetical protein